VTAADHDQHSAQLLASIVESSDDAIITKTLEGVITSCNPAAERIYGYPRAELVGKPVTTVIPDDQLHTEAMILDRISSGRKVENYETERVRSDGRRIYVSLTVSPVRDAEGNIVGASSIGRDVTERKRFEEFQRYLEQLERRRDEAIELNDAVVQGLAVAKMALEVGDREAALSAIERTLEAACSHVGNLMEEREEQGPELPTPGGGPTSN
jgi:PAS domain S-box-containing protein